MVATNDVRFLEPGDFDAHEIRVAIRRLYPRRSQASAQLLAAAVYAQRRGDVRALSDIPEALQNTVEIAKRCNVTVRLGEYFLPQFPTGI